MKRKIVWIVVSCLMALSLVMASCAPAAVEEEKPKEEEKPVAEEKPVVKEEVVEKEKAPLEGVPGVVVTYEKPKYGGVLKLGRIGDVIDWDDVTGRPARAKTLLVTNEALWAGDWAKGPAGGWGTYESEWTAGYEILEHRGGRIAESWEIPTKMEGDTGTIIWHIRKGVHFALNPVNPRPAEVLVGGREVTVDDVIFSLNQQLTDTRAYFYARNPEIRGTKLTSPAPWTVKMEVPWEGFASALNRLANSVNIVPPEVVQKLGDMNKWNRSVGTGPFILVDHIADSSSTLVRNPNYWMKDPVGPGKGNQLPYLDGVKYIVIPDKATMFSAMRTGKLDWIGGDGSGYAVIAHEDVFQLKKETPQLMSHQVALNPRGAETIALKIDKAPYNDIRVRKALIMAIDFDTIKNDYFGGEAQTVTFPTMCVPEYRDAYYGPDPTTGVWPSDAPESLKELYSYNPEKARALLAEAGYPNGFKANVLFENTGYAVDYYSIISDMWSKVSVDLELHPMEAVAFETARNRKGFDHMIGGLKTNIVAIYRMQYIQGEGDNNMMELDDPVVNEAYSKVRIAEVFDRAEANRVYREMMKYFLEQAYAIPAVIPSIYVVWWPWIKNYSGEQAVGNNRLFFEWVWIDQAMKKSMGY